MKKMMVAVCAVALAAVAQAASVDWSVASKSVKDADGANLGGATYYLVNTSAASWALDALADGTVTADNITTQDYYLGQGTGGTSSKTPGVMATKTVTSASLTEGAYYNLAYVIFNDGKYFVSGAAEALAYNPSGSIETEGKPAAFEGTLFAESLSGGWKAAEAVPEPTSGLLLLLGMAGLALRRRRA